MPAQNSFEFEAPQFIDSWENATNIDDGADNFFDALETLEPYESQINRRNSYKNGPALSDNDKNYDIIRASSGIIRVQKISEDIENLHALTKDDENKERRLSLKRKASPLKDRNICVPSSTERQRLRKIANKPAIRFLPTIAESPVLLTKNRVRPKSVKKSPEKRLILKPVRKRNIGICIKPLPKPPTIPEPFNITEAGKHVHHCYEDPPSKEISFTPVTPGRKRMKTKHKNVLNDLSSSETPAKCGPFSFYERDQQIMKRKLERMAAANEEHEQKFQFKAKSPTVLKKEPFRPEVPGRILEAVGPELSTEGRARKRAEHGLVCFEERKVQELEENLFVFKTHSGPKANSSFISTSSSSRKNFFNSSMTSSIASDKSMAFSFYERDKEMLKRREERMKQIEVSRSEFKAREPTVLTKEPFWPEIESRTITVSASPGLATTKRAEERKKFEDKKKMAAARQKALEEELRKAEEEEIRKLRKTLEFKATCIKK